MNLVENLKWRYATKKFDASKMVSKDELQKLKEAVQLSASSYGLQLYKVLIVSNKELKEKLKPAAWGQDQLTDASHIFVFCNYTERKNEHIDDYIRATSKIQDTPIEKLEGYSNLIKQSTSSKSDVEWQSWSQKQTYLALSNLLAACAELKIDSCPIEGFEPEKFNAILGLEEQGLNAAVIATVGYRSSEDHTQFRKKVRKPMEILFEEV
ncbi:MULTISPECIES: NAD(P)H-dependent oxidoreductase [Flagellimonas]|uniref:NAD(P)H-dependent oxidoreductase n=1 Tax=Flagellimonas marinaquae TaxID=254955 RepID=A0AA48KN21_9FLAO|nr:MULTISPECIES: NAD(P)H-dependent oxidoreductase [Allomuricauda]MCA0959782.1 NAD(P)H-dependent oxidoreductase [Allomuricauda ruestringensis]BDW93724.1 NAD(P)H-dependent oxidoreductase [Allomuricauda aquimarina]